MSSLIACRSCGDAFQSGYNKIDCIPCRAAKRSEKTRQRSRTSRIRSGASPAGERICTSCGMAISVEWGPWARMCPDCRDDHRRTVDIRGILVEFLARTFGWSCGICAEPIDRSLAFPHPQSASLDHVVSVAAGGADVMENLRITHLVCNIRRGAGLPPAPTLNRSDPA